jgi:hypothetical protein
MVLLTNQSQSDWSILREEIKLQNIGGGAREKLRSLWNVKTAKIERDQCSWGSAFDMRWTIATSGLYAEP